MRMRATISRHRLILTLAVATAIAGLVHDATGAETSTTEAGITLKSVSVTFPTSDSDLPGGEAAQVVVQNCSACHSPAMILHQPALSETVWREEVNKMRNVYKAPVAPEDIPAIVAYLVAHKGSK